MKLKASQLIALLDEQMRQSGVDPEVVVELPGLHEPIEIAEVAQGERVDDQSRLVLRLK